ncbi:AHH domain-containing protein [Erwinia sp. CGal63]|uniref:AHH domain-containing protein n=1 Tax=Erwinia sp. CGal63 TaxID=2919889 RepID=UPI00300A24D0
MGDPLTWVDPLGWMSCSTDAATLRKNMTEAGMITPGYKNAAHHIVMSNSSDPRMVELRLKMDEFDLHFNDFYNGVFLPTSSKEKLLSNAISPAHSKIHINIYKQNVYDRLIKANNADEFVDGLDSIRN